MLEAGNSLYLLLYCIFQWEHARLHASAMPLPPINNVIKISEQSKMEPSALSADAAFLTFLFLRHLLGLSSFPTAQQLRPPVKGLFQGKGYRKESCAPAHSKRSGEPSHCWGVPGGTPPVPSISTQLCFGHVFLPRLSLTQARV